MKKVVLFSPNGYVGSFIKERLEKEKRVGLYEFTRDSNPGQYTSDYDILVYSASITSVRRENADKYVQDNVVAAVSMVNFSKEHSIKRIIYLSSDEIYGELNTDKVTDKAVMVNPSLYAATKYIAEKIIMESGIPYYILRMPGVVGRVWGKNFIYNLMEKIRNNEQVALYNVNRKFNNILDIDDLTLFINLLCERPCDTGSDILLLGNTECVKLKEVVSHIKNLYHSTSVVCSVETDQKRYFTLDVRKAMEYGYQSKEIYVIIDELYGLREGHIE